MVRKTLFVCAFVCIIGGLMMLAAETLAPVRANERGGVIGWAVLPLRQLVAQNQTPIFVGGFMLASLSLTGLLLFLALRKRIPNA